MKFPLQVLGALLCGIAAPALAQDQDRRFYLGVDLGQGHLNRDFSEYDGQDGDASEVAWKLRFGWRISRNWAFEAAYAALGDYDGRTLMLAITGPANQPVAVAPGDLTTSAKIFDASVVGTWPITEQFHLNGSVGLARREMRTAFSPVLLGAPSFRAQDGDLALQYGLGLGFSLNDAWDLCLTWTTTRNLEGEFEYPVNQADPSMLSVGVRYRL